MNTLGLRINKGGGKKLKSSLAFSALQISSYLDEFSVLEHSPFKQFIEAPTADEQLATLKDILDIAQEVSDETALRFLAIVYCHAEVKHPVKLFLARQITKRPKLSTLFPETLATQINNLLQVLPDSAQSYKLYTNTVTNVAACIESFPAGVSAVRIVEVPLAGYLKKCLECCVETLSESTLSPTEKNEIFSLSHTTLRLLLNVIQKCDSAHTNDIQPMFYDLRGCVKLLLFDNDVPMDTKSVCGILYLGMRCVENGGGAWVDVLSPSPSDDDLKSFLSSDASQLSLYSAIATTVAMDRLQPSVVALCDHMLDIAERNSSESTFVLGATRTLVQISKNLTKITDRAIGLDLIALLLRFIWAHLDHNMDSVRHLTAQLMGNVVKYCAKLKNEGNDTALNSLYSSLSSLDRSRKSYYVTVTSLTNELGAKSVMEQMPSVIQDVIAELGVQAVQASATTTLETLLQKHANESTADVIHTCWIEPIISTAGANIDSSVLNILEGLLVKAVKFDKDIMTYILLHIKDPELKSQCDLKCTLMLLSVARKCNALDGPGDDITWKGVIDYDVLKMAAWDAVDETRILCLSLIVESPKSTEPFTRLELRFVLHFLKYNVNAQSPNFRQSMLSLIKKFLKRIEDSYRKLKPLAENNDYKASESVDTIVAFMNLLREFCFRCLIPGANLGRRQVALQVLEWCDRMVLKGYSFIRDRYISHTDIDTLLRHLEDSYESNKALALAILDKCPTKGHNSQPEHKFDVLNLECIIEQASSLKPTECVSAAYKLDLLRTKLPERVLTKECDIPEAVTYSLLSRLQNEFTKQVALCKQSILQGAVKGPMYGIIHCMARLVTKLDTQAISSSQPWSTLLSSMITSSYSACAAASTVVNNSSPEGHLPNDLGCVSDHGNDHGVTLEDGRQVTAQMVLLCAWRTVKEVSLLLGELSSTLTISGEGSPSGSLTPDQVSAMGQFFTRLLAETKHRGAFEQAYVGFTKLLARLWRSVSPCLHQLPRQWLTELMAAIASSRRHPGLSSTRRSAGLPFMIQALVTTELQVQGNPKCFHECMATLLRLARTPQIREINTQDIPCDLEKENVSNEIDKQHPSSLEQDKDCPSDVLKNQQKDRHPTLSNENNCVEILESSLEQEKDGPSSDVLENQQKDGHPTPSNEDDNVETRTHAINILRALFRNTNLDEVVSSYVGEGLMIALQGFEGRTWMERNSSTLLFSALMVRVFGVQRSKDGDNLCVRNRMTGRIFFLRYPKLYDFMLNKLVEVSSSKDQQLLQPSLYPILLLLARLYPSSLEGTVSNLKLVSFVSHVTACARSSVLKTRQLAAKAVVPLISPQRYVQHLEELFEFIADQKMNRNFCHGILLQLIKLLEAKPEDADMSYDRINKHVNSSLWILNQAADIQMHSSGAWVLREDIHRNPCYLLVDDYVKVLNLVIMKFLRLIRFTDTDQILDILHILIFKCLPDANKEIILDFVPTNTCGREICLSNCLYLYFIILNKTRNETFLWSGTQMTIMYFETGKRLSDLVEKSLKHNDYEVVLSALNFLLILHGNLELENAFHENLNLLFTKDLLETLRQDPRYLESLCFVLKNNKYAECVQKTLKILNCETDTEKSILQMKLNNTEEITNEIILKTLFECLENDNLTHIYLETLSNFVTKLLAESNLTGKQMLDVIRVIFDCSSSGNRDETREVVVKFLEKSFDGLLKIGLDGLTEADIFEYEATIAASLAILLEDDNATLRQRISNIINPYWTSNHVNKMACSSLPPLYFTQRVVSTRAGEVLRYVWKDRDIRVLLVLASLDFRAEVCIADGLDDECRVFDTNERHNTYLEESISTYACMEILKSTRNDSTAATIQKAIDCPIQRRTLQKLCGKNFDALVDIIKGVDTFELVNPKIRTLRSMLDSEFYFFCIESSRNISWC